MAQTMKYLNILNDSHSIRSGSIIRLFDVRRFDLKKSKNNSKGENDFYDYIVVDLSAVKKNSVSLINVTTNNPNKGSILAILKKHSVEVPLIAGQLKKYFGPDTKVMIKLND